MVRSACQMCNITSALSQFRGTLLEIYRAFEADLVNELKQLRKAGPCHTRERSKRQLNREAD